MTPGDHKALERPEAGRAFLPVLASLLAMAALVLGCYAHPYLMQWVSNSDQLTVVMLVDDLLRDPGYFATWSFSRAPYLFPDGMLLALVRIGLQLTGLGDGLLRSLLADTFLQILIFLSLTATVVCRVTGSRFATALLAGTGVLALATLAGVYLSTPNFFESFFTHFYRLLYTPLHHIGAALAAQAAAVLVFGVTLRQWRPTITLTVLALLSAASIASNPLFLVYATGPICVGLIGLRCRRAVPHIVAVLAVTALAAGVGLLAFQHLEKTPVLDEGGSLIPRYLAGEARFISALAAMIIDNWAATLPFFIVPLLIFFVRSRPARIIRPSHARPDDDIDAARLFFGLFAASAVLATAAVIGLKFDTRGALRYFMPGFLWPLILAVAYTAHQLTSRPGWRLPFAGFTLTAALALPAANGFPTPVIATPYARCAQYLNDHARDLGLHDGLAGYWESRQVEMLSGRRITVVQAAPAGSEVYGSNSLWAVEAAGPPVRPTDFNFILAWHSDEIFFNQGRWTTPLEQRFVSLRPEQAVHWSDDINRELLNRYGPPDRTATCGPADVWIYDRPGFLASRFFAGYLRPFTDQLRLRGETTLPGTVLPGTTGHVIGRTKEARPEDQDGPGDLIHLRLPAAAGKYRVDIRLGQGRDGETREITVAGRDGAIELVVPFTGETGEIIEGVHIERR